MPVLISTEVVALLLDTGWLSASEGENRDAIGRSAARMPRQWPPSTSNPRALRVYRRRLRLHALMSHEQADPRPSPRASRRPRRSLEHAAAFAEFRATA